MGVGQAARRSSPSHSVVSSAPHPPPGAVVPTADSAEAGEALPGGAHRPLVLQAVVHGELAGPGSGAWPSQSPPDPGPRLAQNNEMQSDLNILQVWSQGLSGQGVVVSVLDDGIEKDHPDLWANYVSLQGWGGGCLRSSSWWQPPHVSTYLPQDPLASYDFKDFDPDPQPRYTPSDENR